MGALVDHTNSNTGIVETAEDMTSQPEDETSRSLLERRVRAFVQRRLHEVFVALRHRNYVSADGKYCRNRRPPVRNLFQSVRRYRAKNRFASLLH